MARRGKELPTPPPPPPPPPPSPTEARKPDSGSSATHDNSTSSTLQDIAPGVTSSSETTTAGTAVQDDSATVVDEVLEQPSDSEGSLRRTPPPSTVNPPSTPNKRPSMVSSLIEWLDEGYNLASSDITSALSWKFVDGVGNCLVDGDEPAHITLIGMISSSWFALTPDGGWEPGNSRSPSFAKHKASAYLVSPGAEPFDAMWARAMNNLRDLENSGCRDGYEVVSAVKRSGLRFSWPLFEKIPSPEVRGFTDELNTESPVENNAEDPWLGWTVSPQVVWHLHNIQATHRPIPLPAWDKEGKLIPPALWDEMLKGAVVKAKMIARQYHFQDKRQSVVALEPVDLIVVMDPVVKSTSPIRNRDLKAGPSPSKRKRRAV